MPNLEGSIRLLVVDDHEMVRRGVAAMLEPEPDIEVCAMVGSATDAVAAARELQPTVVLLDVRLQSDGSGIDVARALRSVAPACQILMFSGIPREADVVAAAMAGATGFVQKGLDPEQLAGAIRTIAAGGTIFDEQLTAAVFDRLKDEEDEPYPPLAELSDREREILQLMCDGHSNREIAQALHLAEKTVKNHITHLLAKLGVRRRTEAIRLVSGRM